MPGRYPRRAVDVSSSSQTPALARDLRRLVPGLTAAALGLGYLLVQPPGADLPAQLYRAQLFADGGFRLWDNLWYSGHYLLGYSVLYPPLAVVFTPRLLGALAAVVTAILFEALARRHFGPDSWAGSTWLAVGLATELASGRLTFALGLTGVAATALLLRIHFEQPRARLLAAAVLAAVLTALASPVAALFAALVGAAPALAHRRDRRALWGGGVIVVGALAPVAVLEYAFPTGGHQPDAFSTVWPLVLIGLALLAVLALGSRRRSPYTVGITRQPTLAVGVGLYLLGCLAAFALSTPLGANANRLGELLAGPLVALLLYPLRARRLALGALLFAVVPLTYIQVKDAVSDVARGAAGGAYSAAYYQPLLRYLDTRPGAQERTFRLEIPITRGHWESYWVASQLPLARGWERQLDIHDNPEFYGDGGGRDAPALSAAAYHRWLQRNAVAYVAVAAAPPDYSSRREVALIDRGLPYLRLLRRLPNWRVYAVVHPTPVVSGAARLTGMGQSTLLLNVRRTGSAVVRVRYSPYWQLVGVPGCVAPDGSRTRLQLRGTGPALLTISFSSHRIAATSPRCN